MKGLTVLPSEGEAVRTSGVLLTAAAVGNVGVEAVATVAMILWIEATCGELMAPYLEPGEAGVGTRVAVDHTGAAFAGRPVEVHARVVGIKGRRIIFAVRLDQNPARVAWYRQELADRMAQHGLAYDPHPDYPLRPSRALRACVYAAERDCADAFVRTVMRGYWSERRDISDLAVLQAMADEVGLGPRAIADVIADEHYKAAVVENTGDAIARGVFGVPSFILEGKLFFGSDRMDLLDAALGCRVG